METTVYDPLPITQWAEEDRPREKMLKRGVEALTDSELIAILLGSGTKKVSAIRLGQILIKQLGGLDNLARCDVQELIKIKGVGPAKAVSLVAAFELGRRRAMTPVNQTRISGAEDASTYLIPRIGDYQQEIFHVLFLNRNHVVIGEKSVFKGGVHATVVDTKVIFREAVNHLASSLIVAHNHPSGNLRPSLADIDSTYHLYCAGEIFGIRVLDHLIISSKSFFSLRENGYFEEFEMRKRRLEGEED